MRKTLPVALVLMFSWLQLYQVCDASEDTIEVVSGRLETLSQKGPILHNPAAPDDDPDTAMPFVAGEFLNHESMRASPLILVAYVLPLLSIHPGVPLLAASSKDLSPPGRLRSAASPPISKFVLDCSPANILAPPIA